MSTDESLSIIILSFNSRNHIAKCVESIIAAPPTTAPTEILIFENGSDDGSPALVRQLEQSFPGIVKGLFSPRNIGTTASRNNAIARASGSYLLILDSDVSVPEGTIDALLDVLEESVDYGIVAPKLVYGDGSPQLSVDTFPTLGRKIRRFFSLKSLEHTLEPKRQQRRYVDYAISAFWILRRQTFDEIGPFDERIFYSPEDVDYCIRIWKAGMKVVYEPKVYAIHHGQELSRRLRRPYFTWKHVNGLAYLFTKHSYCFSRSRLYQRLGLSRKSVS